MEIIGTAEKDKNNGSIRITYKCECGYIGTTRLSRFKNQKWCKICARKKAQLLENSYEIKGKTAFIDISTDKFPNTFCRIDAKNIHKVIDGNGRWFAANFCTNVIYAVRNVRGDKMHRVIAGISCDRKIDHDDGDGLNNCESNLNIGCQSMNMRNISLSARNKSGVIGVVPSPTAGKWIAQGSVDGVRFHLGTFSTISEAAKSRRKFEKVHGFNKNHGRKAK